MPFREAIKKIDFLMEKKIIFLCDGFPFIGEGISTNWPAYSQNFCSLLPSPA